MRFRFVEEEAEGVLSGLLRWEAVLHETVHFSWQLPFKSLADCDVLLDDLAQKI